MILSRRQFFRKTTAVGGILAASGGVVVLNGCSREEAAQSSGEEGTTASGGQATTTEMAAEDRFADQVQSGLEYFRGRAEEQLPLVEALLAAIEAGSLEEAREAYIEARPPYEEIEVLAGNFENTDSDIDARPYSFDEGESSEDYRGFHRIEGLIFRDEDLEAAVPYAERLVESVVALQEDLTREASFNAATHFEGMIGLANEIPSKKISSEEETYSDQSLLIFRHNLIGVYSQFEPFESEVSSADQEAAAAVAEAYEAARAVIEGYFTEGRPAAEAYSSIGLGVRGEIVQSTYSFRDTLIRAGEALELV